MRLGIGGDRDREPGHRPEVRPEVAVPDPTVTATGVASPRVPPFSLAVTVVADAPSPTDSGDTDRVTPLDAVSSSSTVTSTEAATTVP